MKVKAFGISWTAAHNPFLERCGQVLSDSFDFVRIEARDVIKSTSKNKSGIKNKIHKIYMALFNVVIIIFLFLLELGIKFTFRNNLQLPYTYRRYCFDKITKIMELDNSNLVKIKNWGFPFNQIQEQLNIAKKIMSQTDDANIIILPEDNILYFSAIYIYLYKNKEIPCVIVPYSAGTTKVDWESAFFSRKDYRTRFQSFLVNSLFPHYAHTYKNEIRGLPDLAAVLCTEFFDQRPKVPWSGISGSADAYFVVNKSYEYFEMMAQVNSNKLFVIESVEQSLINRLNLRLEFFANTKKRGKIFLVLLPPDAFPLPDSTQSEFKSHLEIVDFLVNLALNMESKKTKFIFAFHPSTKNGNYFINKYKEVVFSQQQVITDVASADVVICFGSGLIRTIIDLGIPVLDWNIYGFKSSSDFSDIIDGRYTLIKSASDYAVEVNKALIRDNENLSSKVASQELSLGEALCLFLDA
jgi:hypothetical protein